MGYILLVLAVWLFFVSAYALVFMAKGVAYFNQELRPPNKD